MFPHPDKLAKGGEDAYYANSKFFKKKKKKKKKTKSTPPPPPKKNIRLLAVADGVGGWNNHGVDPSKYSRELCRHVESLWNKHFFNYLTNPKKLIIDAAK